MNLIDLLDLAKLSAEAAGKFLIENRITLNEEISNIGRDIKLEADTKTESLIRDILSKSDIPILGEEGEHNTKDFGSKYWVVDPLDGTANFSRGIPIFEISSLSLILFSIKKLPASLADNLAKSSKSIKFIYISILI